MPMYDYTCRQCTHRFTVLLRVTDKAKVTCPRCGSEETRREFSPFATKTGSSSGCNSGGRVIPGG